MILSACTFRDLVNDDGESIDKLIQINPDGKQWVGNKTLLYYSGRWVLWDELDAFVTDEEADLYFQNGTLSFESAFSNTTLTLKTNCSSQAARRLQNNANQRAENEDDSCLYVKV